MLKPVGILTLALAFMSPLALAQWEATITATTDGGLSETVTFGTAEGATDGLDSVDVTAPPPPPTPPPLSIAFRIEQTVDSLTLSLDLTKDMRAPIGEPGDEITWTLVVNAPQEGFTLTWDVSAIPEGYSVTLDGTNLRTESSRHFDKGSYELTLRVAVMPPLISSVTVTGSPAKEGDTITVTATGETGCTATFSIEGIVTDVAMTETDGTYTGTYTVQPGDNAKDAVVTVTFTKDQQTDTDTSQRVTIDTTPPQIQITSPADGSFTNQTSITVTGTVQDDNLDKVYVNDQEVQVTDGSFTATVDLPNEGDNVITVRATDVVGHETTASVTIIRDTTLPQIQITSPADGSWTNQTSITVTGTVSDANLDRVEVNGVQATISNGTFSADVQLPNEGDNAITARAFDKAGNTNEHAITVKRDTAKPTLANPSVSPAVVKNGDQITLEVEASDELSGLASVTADIDGLDTAAAQTTIQLNPVEGQPGKYSATYTISQNNTAPNGQYTITFTATDAAGNASDPVTATVTLRNLLITLQTDKTALIPDGQSQATLTATVTDASGAGLERETVKISFAPDSEQIGQLGDVEEVGGGIYRCTYTSPELAVEETPKTVSFVATVRGVTVPDVTSDPVSITLRFITMTVTVQPDTLTACGTQTATVTVTLLDENGQPIQGETIQFSTDNGSISPTTATTDENGTCTVTYTAGTVAGTATITATSQGPRAAGVSESAQVTLTPGGVDPDKSSIAATPDQVSADDPRVTVTVTARDVHENLIPNASVEVFIDGNPALTGTTDQNGIFQAEVTLPTQAGPKTISAEINDVPLTGTATVTVNPGQVVSIEISPDRALVVINRTRQFTVTATDAHGNTFTPSQVTWEVVGNIGTIDQNGLFTATAEGIGQIRATVDGVTDTTGDIRVVSRIPGDCAGGEPTAEFPNGEPDGKVDVFDLVQMARHWHETRENTTATPEEFDAMDIAGPESWEEGDGVIDIYDLIVLADNFGMGTGQGAPSLIARLPVLEGAALSLKAPTTPTTIQRGDEIRTLVGAELRIDLPAEGLKGLKGYSFELVYDRDALDVSFSKGTLMKDLRSFEFAKPASSSMTVAGVILGDGSVQLENGTLGTLTVKAKKPGEHPLILRNVVLIMEDGSSFTLPELRYRVVVREPVSETKLFQNYPNPFNPETWIPFQLKEACEVVIRIYDMNGRLIRTLNLGYLPAGPYLDRGEAAYWDGRNEYGEPVSSGVYIYQLQAGGRTLARKMVILK